MSIEVVTFGCRLNSQESAAIRINAERAGLAGLAVVNTCAVTGEAVAKARQAIRRLARERGPVVVTGCAAQTEPQAFAVMPEVARVIGNAEKLRPEAWRSGERVAVGDIMRETRAAPVAAEGQDRTRAFVAVQTGCDHRCTFCIIPFGRGNARSHPADDVVAQVRRLADAGTAEVVLTGVDLTSYGRERPGAPTLGALVKRILREVPQLARLRLSSVDSVEADDDLIDAFASEPRLMPHLHLSLQAGDDLILKRMKRRHARADAVAFCARLRRLRPDIAFGADLIAGFPTETEAMFARTLDLIDDCGLATVHAFPFSPRPGTPAARMPQVARGIVTERAARLRGKAAAALARHLDGEIGRTRRVLAERGGVGRTEQFVPVTLPAAVPAGTLHDVVIAGHDGRRLTSA